MPGPETPARPLRGEFIGILSGEEPAEVRSGLEAAIHYAREEASFF